MTNAAQGAFVVVSGPLTSGSADCSMADRLLRVRKLSAIGYWLLCARNGFAWAAKVARPRKMPDT
jgi:hypothetical protein